MRKLTFTTPPLKDQIERADRRTSRWARFACLFKGLLCVVLTAQLVPSSQTTPPTPKPSRARSLYSLQYQAGGTRWLDSRADEVVHFICQGGAPYRISLDSASLSSARIPAADHPRYLEALRTAVADWAALMGCNRFRVELDSPYPNTRIYFTPIHAPGTLAMATRAGDVTLNLRRAWFPGDKRHGNYGPKGQLVSFYWVVAHELGHVWGLAHSPDPQSLMYPSQCSTCRWSSFEQAAGNVIRAASRAPAWSRPHYANRYFAKTPVDVVNRLLGGEWPDERVRAETGQSCQTPRSCNPTLVPGAAAAHPACGWDREDPAVALLGWQLFRLPETFVDQGLHRLTPAPPTRRRRPPPLHSDFPLEPRRGKLTAILGHTIRGLLELRVMRCYLSC